MQCVGAGLRHLATARAAPAQRQQQRQLVAIEHLARRLVRVDAEVHTARFQGLDDLLLGARRSVPEQLLDRRGHLTQRRGKPHRQTLPTRRAPPLSARWRSI
jgi:hypothetical protein